MGITEVKQNIRGAYARAEAQLYALCLYYAGLAINYFRSVQPAKTGAKGKFWHNQTGQAALRMFTDAFKENLIYGWFMAHGVQYGAYLELANDRKHEAIRPIIQRFAGRFLADARKIFQG